MDLCLTKLVSQMMNNYIATMNQMDVTYTQRINDLMTQKQNCQNKINQLFLNRLQTIVNTLQKSKSLKTEPTSNIDTNYESNTDTNHHQNGTNYQQNGIDYIHLLLKAAEQIDIKHDNNNNNNNNNISKQEQESIDIDKQTVSNHNAMTFECSHCNKQFYKTVLLKRHIEMAHNMDDIDDSSNNIEITMNIKPKIKNTMKSKGKNGCNGRNYHCSLCDNKYQTRAGLRGHITKIHKTKTMKKMVIKPRSFMREKEDDNDNDNEYESNDNRLSESERSRSRSRSRGRNKGYKKKWNKEEDQNDDESNSESDDMEKMIKSVDKMSNDKLKCPKCQKRFDRKHPLKSHLIVHTKKRPYICSWCKLRYKRECTLKLHQRKYCKNRNKHKGNKQSINNHTYCNQKNE